MKKTKTSECENKITVDITGLQNLLSVGRNTASKIGEDSGAIIRIGRRKLYIVSKINEYMAGLVDTN